MQRLTRCVNFGRGHPHASLLPFDLAKAGCRRTTECAAGEQTPAGMQPSPLDYGDDKAHYVKAAIAAFVARHEPVGSAAVAAAADVDCVTISAGISQGLDITCLCLTSPGDVVLVEPAAYHLSFQVMRDHGLEIFQVPPEQTAARTEAAVAGMLGSKKVTPDSLERAYTKQEEQGRRVRLLYIIPAHQNPCGFTYTTEERQAICAWAESKPDLLIVADEVYQYLHFQEMGDDGAETDAGSDAGPGPAPAPFAGMSPSVVSLNSFSKLLGPGLRVGWIWARSELVERFERAGYIESGGPISWFTAHVVANMLNEAAADNDQWLTFLNTELARRRRTLLSAIDAHEWPPGTSVESDAGGYFVWMNFPVSVDAVALLETCREDVLFIPGHMFSADGSLWKHQARLCFAYEDESLFEPAVMRLAQAACEVHTANDDA